MSFDEDPLLSSTTLCRCCLKRVSPFAFLSLFANKVCLGKQLSRIERAPILATTPPRCNSHSDIYLQCHLRLINIGMINTCSAHLPGGSEN